MRQHPQAANAPMLVVGVKAAREVVTITSPKQLTELYGWLPSEAEDLFSALDMRPPMIVRAGKYPAFPGQPITLTDEQIAEWRETETPMGEEVRK